MRISRIVATYRLEIVSFFTGAIVLTFELSASRIVAPYLGNTIYIWTSIIGAVLIGLAAGYTIGGNLADRHHQVMDVVLLLTMGAFLILFIDILKDPLLSFVSLRPWPLRLQTFIASVLLFIPPTLVLGAVSPYLARLSLTDLSTSGKHIARINAAGTIGSLVGTFVTGYLLFGFVGTRSILGILAFCAVAISFLLLPKGWLLPRLLLAAVAVWLTFLPPSLHIFDVTVYKDIDTRYGRYVVGNLTLADKQRIRVLQPDLQNWESGMYLGDRSHLFFPYTQAFAEMAKLRPDAHRILMVGGGAFTTPDYMARLSSANNVDVVEIDGQLTSISAKYFQFRQPANLHVIQADGRQFFNRNAQQYNLIFLDAFSGQVPPFQLVTKQATQRVYDSLAPGGVVMMNLVAPLQGAGAGLAASVVETYKQVFPHVALFSGAAYLTPNIRQNLLLVASQKPLPTGAFEKATAGEVFTAKLVNSDFPDTHHGMVLTDNYAPVERLMGVY